MTRTNPKPATCDKCNSENVAWFKSKKSGKWYLCEVFTDEEGDRVTSHRDFHSQYCGKPGAHEAAQQDRYGKREQREDEKELSEEVAQQTALDISKLYDNGDLSACVVRISNLARENKPLAWAVSEIWNRQGEHLLNRMLIGAVRPSSAED